MKRAVLPLPAPSAGAGGSPNKGLSSQRSNACLIGLSREDALEGVVPCCPCTCPANSAELGSLYSPYLSRGPIAAPGASGESCTKVDQS